MNACSFDIVDITPEIELGLASIMPMLTYTCDSIFQQCTNINCRSYRSVLMRQKDLHLLAHRLRYHTHKLSSNCWSPQYKSHTVILPVYSSVLTAGIIGAECDLPQHWRNSDAESWYGVQEFWRQLPSLFAEGLLLVSVWQKCADQHLACIQRRSGGDVLAVNSVSYSVCIRPKHHLVLLLATLVPRLNQFLSVVPRYTVAYSRCCQQTTTHYDNVACRTENKL